MPDLSDPAALKQQGCTQAENGEFDLATATFSRAVTLAQSDATLHEMLAQCLMELNRNDEAYEVARTATRLDPEWSCGFLTLSRAARNVGRLQEAVEAMSKCRSMDGSMCQELAVEFDELQLLLEEHIGRQVGLPQLRIRQSFGGAIGPGGVVWECGLLLAAFIQQNGAASLRGVRVLELGSGTGVVGLTAACLGAHATLTDTQHMLPILRANAVRNSAAISAAGGSAAVSLLDWASCAESPVCCQPYDVILGADLVYHSGDVLQNLSAVLQKIVQCNPGCSVYYCHKERHEDVDEDLFSYVRGIGLKLHPVASLAGHATVKVFVHKGEGGPKERESNSQ